MPIDTFVVLMMENRSFDHYLGWLPQADGHQAGLSYTDKQGNVKHTAHLTGDFQGCAHPDPDHSWEGGRTQVNGGRMDGFLRSGDNDEFSIGYYLPDDLGFIPSAAKAMTTYDRCSNGTPPALSFVDPSFANEGGGTSGDEHPHGDVRVGQAFMSDVVHAFMESPHWKRGALFIVYDEWGGFFDHVRPPRVPDIRSSSDINHDFGQMGIRIPAVAVSPWARRKHVDHTIYGFESILKMIEYRFRPAALTRRRPRLACRARPRSGFARNRR